MNVVMAVSVLCIPYDHASRVSRLKVNASNVGAVVCAVAGSPPTPSTQSSHFLW